MGKTQSTGNLTNALAQDSSNNIGIGGAANASFKLRVTGSSAGDSVYAIGDGASSGGALKIKQYASSAANEDGYSTISTLNTGVFYFTSASTSPNFKNFVLNPSGLTDNTLRTYTLPNASGTLALTSDLGSYLPLTGGTLTGALSGTSATFNSNQALTIIGTNSTSANNTITGYSADLYAVAVRQRGASAGISGTNFMAQIISATGAEGLEIYTPNSKELILGTNATARLTIGSTGAATFSSDVFLANSSSLRLLGGSLRILNSANSATYGYILSSSAWKGSGNNNPSIAADSGLGINFFTNGSTTESMTIASGGNVGIGTSSPAAWGGSYTALQMSNTGTFASNGTNGTVIGHNFYYDGTNDKYLTTGVASRIFQFQGNIRFELASSGSGGSNLSFSEAMRITSGGEVLVGTTSTTGAALSVFKTVAGTGAEIRCTAGSGNPIVLYNRMSVAGTTSNYILAGQDGSADRIYIYGNGNIVNTNNSYGTLSDISLKENIIDATPKLNDLLQLKVRNFNLIGDKTKQIGFIAQEFEEVFPNMVDIDGKSGNKMIKTSVLIPMLVKAIQEQTQIIKDLEARIVSLESK